jgi:hypothetical protein
VTVSVAMVNFVGVVGDESERDQGFENDFNNGYKADSQWLIRYRWDHIATLQGSNLIYRYKSTSVTEIH